MSNEASQNAVSFSKSMRNILLLATIIILTITIYLTLRDSAEITQDSLQHEIAEIQKRLPVRIDAFTELKSIALKEMNIQYSFIVTSDPNQANEFNSASKTFAQQLEENVKRSACQNKTTRRYINNNVTLSYLYKDNQNKTITHFDIPANYCQQ